jgi:hypothetical protein
MATQGEDVYATVRASLTRTVTRAPTDDSVAALERLLLAR